MIWMCFYGVYVTDKIGEKNSSRVMPILGRTDWLDRDGITLFQNTNLK